MQNPIEIRKDKDGIERRLAGEVRMDGGATDGKTGMLVGHAAVFNTPADIGGFFREQIAPGAFTAAIQNDDVRALIDHNSSLVLGRNRAGTLRLAEDERGLRVEIDPPDTSYAKDLIVSMKRGDITQMSFGFRALKETWDEEQDPPLRTIVKAELFDVSPVTFPAYAETQISVRAFQQAGEILKRSNPSTAAIAAKMRMKQGLLERGIR
ncbi:MAG: HK97 family phage prohead protease [Robiginitomaculum sp.]|nr:HK97 family phage prohead protease [Robiginitomaculum sp.]